MPIAPCPSAEELQAYAVGRLSDDVSDTIAEHVDSCDACQASLATLDDADDTLIGCLQQAPSRDPVVAEAQCDAALVRACALSPEVDGAAADRTTRTRVGEELEEYRLLEELGRGGMGRVYKALQTKLDRIVALKILPAARAEDDRAIARFEREMKAIGRLDHPSIVHAYDAREIDGNPVLVMEYVEGMDWSRLLRNCGRISMADACELVRQAAIGLQYAHENGLVHRDVKPSNLMLTVQGSVKLLDLGLARFQTTPAQGEEMTSAGQPMGTADYIAPEQVSDSRSVDIRADIYSLGCTLYKLLTGHAPFANSECRGTFDKLTAHVKEPAPSIHQYDATLPDQLGRLIERMLAKSPDDRPATPRDIAAMLEPFCSGSNLFSLAAQAADLEKSRVRLSGAGSQLAEHPEKPPVIAHAPPSPAARGGWFWGLVGFVGLLVAAGGFSLGVIITIKINNRETQLEVPDGSKVTVSDQGNVDVQVPEFASPEAAPSESGQVAERSKPKVWTVYIDASGNLHCNDAGPYAVLREPGAKLGKVPKWQKALLTRIWQDAATSVHITHHPNAPEAAITSVRSCVIRYSGVETFTVYAVSEPPLSRAPVQLEFRIGARRNTDTEPGLTQEQVSQYESKLWSPEMAAGTDNTSSEFAWFQFTAPPTRENIIVSQRDGKAYILLSTAPESVMVSSDQGDRAWRIVRAEGIKDSVGHPAISVELDEAGGRRMESADRISPKPDACHPVRQSSDHGAQDPHKDHQRSADHRAVRSGRSR